MKHDVPDRISMPPHHLQVNQLSRLEKARNEDSKEVVFGH